MICIRGVSFRETLLSIWFGKTLNIEVTAYKMFLFFSWSTSYKFFPESWEHKSDYAQGQWEQDNCIDLVPIRYTQHHQSLKCHDLSFLESPRCLKYSTIAIYGRTILYCLCLKCYQNKIKNLSVYPSEGAHEIERKTWEKNSKIQYHLMWT